MKDSETTGKVEYFDFSAIKLPIMYMAAAKLFRGAIFFDLSRLSSAKRLSYNLLVD